MAGMRNRAGPFCRVLARRPRRIDRAFFLFTASTPSAIAVGAWSLAVACALSTVFACANMLEMWDLREKLAVPGGALGVLIGVVVVAYTGILLAGSPVGRCVADAAHTRLVRPFGHFVRRGSVLGRVGRLWNAELRLWVRLSPCRAWTAPQWRLKLRAWWLMLPAVRFADYVSGRFRARCGRFAVAVLDRPCGVRPGHSACARAFAHIRQRRSQLLWVALFVLIGGVTLRYSIVGISAST